MTYLNHKAVGLAFVVFAAIPANAAPPIEVAGSSPTATVSYADLNLGSPAGMTVLNGRVRRAAKRLCLDNRVQGVGESMAQRSCLASAIEGATGQIHRAIALSGTQRYASNSTIILSGQSR